MDDPLLPLERESDVLRRATQLVQERLPAGWVFNDAEPQRQSRWKADAVLALTTPRGKRVNFLVEVKRTVVPRDLDAITRRLVTEMEEQGIGPARPMIVARYLSGPSREWLAEREIAYVDATGNMRISIDEPPLFIRDVGADKDPWRGPGRPRGTLKGLPPARVVRALVDFEEPYSVPQLTSLAQSSSGPTYRVIDLLSELGLVRRENRGVIDFVAWRQLLLRWSDDYGLQDSNPVRSYLQPRGLQELSKRLGGVSDLRYAVTGSLAAARWAPYAPPRMAMIYADDIDALAERCDLRPVKSGANVLLVPPIYDVVFDRGDTVESVNYVAPSQAVVDLMTGPGRAPEEALALLDWMEANVRSWRRRPDGASEIGTSRRA